MKRWLKRLLWTGMAVLFVSIIGLEIATRVCDCSNQLTPEERRIVVCEENATYDNESQLLLDSLRTKRAQGITISKADYREAIDRLVIEVAQEQLGIVNGVACRGEIAYVAEGMPIQATLFVKRHELEHLFQSSHDEDSELEANVAAAKEYPIGLLSTIAFSVIKLGRYFSWCCFLVIGWANFKLYFLGMKVW